MCRHILSGINNVPSLSLLILLSSVVTGLIQSDGHDAELEKLVTKEIAVGIAAPLPMMDSKEGTDAPQLLSHGDHGPLFLEDAPTAHRSWRDAPGSSRHAPVEHNKKGHNSGHGGKPHPVEQIEFARVPESPRNAGKATIHASPDDITDAAAVAESVSDAKLVSDRSTETDHIDEIVTADGMNGGVQEHLGQGTASASDFFDQNDALPADDILGEGMAILGNTPQALQPEVAHLPLSIYHEGDERTPTPTTAHSTDSELFEGSTISQDLQDSEDVNNGENGQRLSEEEKQEITPYPKAEDPPVSPQSPSSAVSVPEMAIYSTTGSAKPLEQLLVHDVSRLDALGAKVHVYNLDERFNVGAASFRVGSANSQNDVVGREGQVFDVFHRRYSSLFTDDPASAAVLVVPVLPATMCASQNEMFSENAACVRTAIAEAIEDVKKLGHWDNGRRHFFIAMWDLGICGSQCTYVGDLSDPLECDKYIRSRSLDAKDLLGDAGQITLYNDNSNPKCFRADRDVVMISIKDTSNEKIAAHESPLLSKTTKLYFRGLATNDERSTIAQQFNGVTGAKIIVNQPASQPQVALEVATSEFCLVVRGYTTWSSKLLEAMRAGCVPVATDADVFHMPFSNSILWNRAAVTVTGHSKQAIENAVWPIAPSQVQRLSTQAMTLGAATSFYSDTIFNLLVHEMRYLVRSRAVAASTSQAVI